MKDFSYLLNRSIENIGDIEEVRKNLRSYPFIEEVHKDFNKLLISNPEITDDFHYLKRRDNLSVMLQDRMSEIIYGFILVGNRSILEEKYLQTNDESFLTSFEGLEGCHIFGYGFDKRVVNEYWIFDMIGQILFTARHFYDENIEYVYYDYLWTDCAEVLLPFFQDKKYDYSWKGDGKEVLIPFFKDREGVGFLKDNPNLLIYKITKYRV